MVVGLNYKQGELILERFGVTIPVAIDLDDGTVYIPCRFICEKVLGVAWPPQYNVLTSEEQRYHEHLREVPLTIRTGYPRSPLALPADEAALWIGGINLAKVGNEARASLKDFQDELLVEAQRLLWRTRAASRAALDRPNAANITSSATTSRITRRGEVHYTFTCEECGTTHTLVETEEGTAYLVHGEV